jgi:hypothetical protein
VELDNATKNHSWLTTCKNSLGNKIKNIFFEAKYVVNLAPSIILLQANKSQVNHYFHWKELIITVTEGLNNV